MNINTPFYGFYLRFNDLKNTACKSWTVREKRLRHLRDPSGHNTVKHRRPPHASESEPGEVLALPERPQARLFLSRTLKGLHTPKQRSSSGEIGSFLVSIVWKCLSLVEVGLCRFEPGGFARLSPSASCCSLAPQRLLCCSYKTCMCVCTCVFF